MSDLGFAFQFGDSVHGARSRRSLLALLSPSLLCFTWVFVAMIALIRCTGDLNVVVVIALASIEI